MTTQQTAADRCDAPSVAPAPARRVPLLVALPVIGVLMATITAGILLTPSPAAPPEWLHPGGYACTRPDPMSGSPRDTGQVLESAGAGQYWFHPAGGTPAGPAAAAKSGTGDYRVRTIERGQYDVSFESGPLSGSEGDYVLLQRGSTVVSYVVLAEGFADGFTCSLQQ